MNEIITITTSDYLTHELARQISLKQWHTDDAQWINGIRRSVYECKYFSDCFNVLATNKTDEIVGRLFCRKNQVNLLLWYYGDLFVVPEYRRIGIAQQMIKKAINRITDMGGQILRCYVSPGNVASIGLQKSMSFSEKQYEIFDNILNEGDLMFELDLPSLLNVIPATANEAVFIKMFYQQNIEILHGKAITLEKWKEVLSKNDPDEQNFLICKGSMPIAWLRINGLLNKDMAWISMLVVSDNAHHQGIGAFSIKFAEEFVMSKGFNKLRIHTSEENISAQKLYRKSGYVITEHGECTTGDGVKRMGFTFEKILTTDEMNTVFLESL